jgi:hypothetical protein
MIQFFATPEKLADELVYLADLKQHDTILEPSAEWLSNPNQRHILS